LPADERKAPAWPVFLAALQLGCSAFGGPIAHLGIFRRSYVEQRRWIDPDTFASIVALCQVLPGPTSGQTGFLIDWYRAGWCGAFAGDGKFLGEFSGLGRVYSLKITGDALWVSARPLDQPPGSAGWVIELDRNSGYNTRTH
jgi:chromate transporter